eukprot:6179923-Pleurochrysis_carterae.AAC.2
MSSEYIPANLPRAPIQVHKYPISIQGDRCRTPILSDESCMPPSAQAVRGEFLDRMWSED